MSAPLRLGVLASGRGSNIGALIAARQRGELTLPIALVVSNNSSAGALALARKHGIAGAHISGKTHDDETAALLAALSEHGANVLVLAGYMKRIDPRLVAAFAGRSVNIHPGPLPRFGGPGMYGEHVHRAVLDAGVSYTGPTVHRVTDNYDEGDVLAHRSVAVLPGDDVGTLAARVLAAEHDLYWRTIEATFATPTASRT